jgi:GTPase SAR1 family protein
MSNFDFFESYDPAFSKFAQQAEEYVYTDPSVTLFKLRLFAESLADRIAQERGVDVSGEPSFLNTLRALELGHVVPRRVLDAFHLVRVRGNEGVHSGRVRANHGVQSDAPRVNDALNSLEASHRLAVWFVRDYRDKPLKDATFTPPKKPPEKMELQRPAADPASADGTRAQTLSDTASETASEPNPEEFIRLTGNAAKHIFTTIRQPVTDLDGALDQLEATSRIAKEPFRLAVVGEYNAGKSTLVNALAGARLAYVDVLGATAYPTAYQYGDVSRAELRLRTGQVEQMSVEQMVEMTAKRRGDEAWVSSIAYGVVYNPSPQLRDIEPWDVPGLGGDERDDDAALSFLDKIGGALWVFDAGLLGDAVITKLVAVLNKIDQVDKSDYELLSEYVKLSYPSAFEDVCLISADRTSPEDPALQNLLATVRTKIMATAESDRQKRYDLALADTAGQMKRAITRGAKSIEAFFGFVGHVTGNLHGVRDHVLAELEGWIARESERAGEEAEEDAINLAAKCNLSQMESVEQTFHDHPTIKLAWDTACKAVFDQAMQTWEQGWFDAVRLSLASVPSVELPVPDVQISSEVQRLEWKAIREGIVEGGKAAAIAGVIAAALIIIHWPVMFVGLPIGVLEWWKKRESLLDGDTVEKLVQRVRKASRQFRRTLRSNLNLYVAPQVADQMQQAIEATTSQMLIKQFGGCTQNQVGAYLESIGDGSVKLEKLRATLLTKHGVNPPPDWSARPLIVSPDATGAAKWAHFLSDMDKTIDIILPYFSMEVSPILRHLPVGVSVRILTTAAESERQTAEQTLSINTAEWQGKREVVIIARADGLRLTLDLVAVITSSEALVSYDALDAIGHRTCVWSEDPRGVMAAQAGFAELWTGACVRGGEPLQRWVVYR